jgi:hypothetical protein
LDFRDGVRRTVPGFVGKVGIGRHGINVHAHFLELFVVIRYVAQFGWANESEVSRIEEENTPFTFNVFLGYINEFAVFECAVFERLNFGIDNGHVMASFRICDADYKFFGPTSNKPSLSIK